MAQDTAHAAQHNEWAHRLSRAKWPRTTQTQSNALSGHTGRRQAVQDTAHTCTRRAAEGQERANTPWVGHTGARAALRTAKAR